MIVSKTKKSCICNSHISMMPYQYLDTKAKIPSTWYAVRRIVHQVIKWEWFHYRGMQKQYGMSTTKINRSMLRLHATFGYVLVHKIGEISTNAKICVTWRSFGCLRKHFWQLSRISMGTYRIHSALMESCTRMRTQMMMLHTGYSIPRWWNLSFRWEVST